jgi:tetratricopeptide (TPR) repeat protein
MLRDQHRQAIDVADRALAAARHFEGLGSDELAGAVAGHVLAAYRNTPPGPDADALAAQARVTLKAAAGRAAALGSHDQAVAFLDQALEVTTDPAEQAELLERAGESAWGAGRGEVAENRLGAAVEMRRALGDPDALAGAIAHLGEALTMGMRHEAALAVLEPAAAELVDIAPGRTGLPGAGDVADDSSNIGPGAVALLAQLALAYMLRDQHRQAIDVADRALAAGEWLELAASVSDLLITRGSALCGLARPYEGLATIRAGLDLAEELGLVSLALRGRLNLSAYLMDSDPRASFETSTAAVEIATRLGMRSYTRFLIGNVEEAAIEIGEWEFAIRAVTAARDESPEDIGIGGFGMGVTLAAWRGEDVAAEIERRAAWAEEFGEKGASWVVCGLRAEVAFGAGHCLDACDQWMAVAPEDPMNASQTYFRAGLAGLMGADPDRAAAALAAHERIGPRGRILALDRRLLRAGLAALDGRRVEALREGQTAIAEYERLGLPWRQALGILMLVSTLGPGEPEVRALAVPGREILVRLGARPFLERLDAAIRIPDPLTR